MIEVDAQFTFKCDTCGRAESMLFNGPRRPRPMARSFSLEPVVIPEDWGVDWATNELTCPPCVHEITQAMADAETNARRRLAASRKEAVA